MTTSAHPSAAEHRIVLHASRSARITAVVLLIPLGLILVLGGLFADPAQDGWSIILGAILLVGALHVLTVRAVSTADAVSYGSLIKRRIPAADSARGRQRCWVSTPKAESRIRRARARRIQD